jgi:hypothetical protein
MSDAEDAAADSDKKADENQNGTDKPTETGTVADNEQTIVNPAHPHHQTHKQHRDWYDKANLIVLSFTFAAAVVAAVFTGLAWCTFDSQLDALTASRSGEVAFRSAGMVRRPV